MTIDDEARTRATDDRILQRAVEMRRAFDESFAVPSVAGAIDVENVVIIEVGALKLACRIGQVKRFDADRKVVPLAGTEPALVGIAGIRGRLVPVFNLARLLGVASGGASRWLALCGAEDTVALAFDRLVGFVRARRDDVCALEARVGAPSHVKELLRVGTESHHILDVDSVLAQLGARSAIDAPAARKG